MTRDSDKKPARGARSAPSFVSKSKGSRSHASGEGKTYKKPPANPYAKKGAPSAGPAKGPEAGADGTRPGDRIAKVLARAGVASRRDCEVIIDEGRVTVNGRKVVSPALNVLPSDRITVDGQQIGEAEPPRLWLYHKPIGLVTTEKDELGRKTVFENLPAGLPRVLSVGRLDLNSEGLLLLTNDGALKRKLELPDTGWLRKYRVRVKGSPSEALLDQLRAGVTIDGEDFQPMEVVFDRQQGANAWLTVGIREGRNREVRRAMEHIGPVKPKKSKRASCATSLAWIRLPQTSTIRQSHANRAAKSAVAASPVARAKKALVAQMRATAMIVAPKVAASNLVITLEIVDRKVAISSHVVTATIAVQRAAATKANLATVTENQNSNPQGTNRVAALTVAAPKGSNPTATNHQADHAVTTDHAAVVLAAKNAAKRGQTEPLGGATQPASPRLPLF